MRTRWRSSFVIGGFRATRRTPSIAALDAFGPNRLGPFELKLDGTYAGRSTIRNIVGP